MHQLKYITPFLLTGMLLGCVTLSGTYSIKAVDAEGKDLSNGKSLMADGKNIYSLRNAICRANPNATVIITDIKTGQELKSESPYRCK